MTTAIEPDGTLAATRVMRTVVMVFGFAGGVFFAITVGQMVAQAEYVATAWLIAAGILMFGMPVVAAIICRWLSLAALRRIAGAYTIGYLVIVATWLPAMVQFPLPTAMSPWPLSTTMLGAVAGAIAFPPALAWTTVGVNAALLAFVRFEASGGVNLDVALQDSLYIAAFVAIFVALVMVALRGGRAQDAAAAAARRTLARAAYATARAREETRLDALVHDEVMTALYYASQDRPELASSIRTQAGRALSELARMEGVRPIDVAPISAAAFVSRMRAVVLGVSPDVAFRAEGDRDEPIPADVAAAFAEATAEAVRNSLLHAGDSRVTRTASVTFGIGTVVVAISDDGIGFDTRSVSPHRLGIAVSIRARVEAIPHGVATVTSHRGAGTVVLLTWRSS